MFAAELKSNIRENTTMGAMASAIPTERGRKLDLGIHMR